jgi:hypothetical protein
MLKDILGIPSMEKLTYQEWKQQTDNLNGYSEHLLRQARERQNQIDKQYQLYKQTVKTNERHFRMNQKLIKKQQLEKDEKQQVCQSTTQFRDGRTFCECGKFKNTDKKITYEYKKNIKNKTIINNWSCKDCRSKQHGKLTLCDKCHYIPTAYITCGECVIKHSRGCETMYDGYGREFCEYCRKKPMKQSKRDELMRQYEAQQSM